MKHVLFLLLPGFAAGGCSSQPSTTKVQSLPPLRVAATSKPIVPVLRVSSPTPSKQVLSLLPNSKLRPLALSQMPRGAKSEFFGVCKVRFHPGTGNAVGDFVAHFYAVSAGARGKFSLFLDVFRAEGAPGQSLRLNRLHHVDLTALPSLNGNWAHDSDRVNEADLTWIDARQQIPLLKVKMSGTVISGIAGAYGLIAFPGGLQAKAVSQSFDTYDQPMGGMDVGFVRDKSGQFVVYEQSVSYDLEIPDPAPKGEREMKPSLGPRTYFDWSDKGFVARASKPKR